MSPSQLPLATVAYLALTLAAGVSLAVVGLVAIGRRMFDGPETSGQGAHARRVVGLVVASVLLGALLADAVLSFTELALAGAA